MKVCYFGGYEMKVPRNRIIIKGLRRHGVEVIECNVKGGGKFKRWKKLLSKVNSSHFDVLLTGFPSHGDSPASKYLSISRDVPFVFDAFISRYNTYIFDRKVAKANSFYALKQWLWDKISCELADLVFLDTKAHINYFISEFKLPRSKFVRIWAGADDDLFRPMGSPRVSRKKFVIGWHGSYTPLPGVPTIVQSAKILEGKDIVFNLLGSGQTFKESFELAKRLGTKNVNFLGRVHFSEVPKFLMDADLCLGSFGSTRKADIVIPTKIFEYIAMKKPVVTGESQAIKEAFEDKKNIFLCEMSDAQSLADAILYLKDNPMLRNKIANEGYKLFKKEFSIESTGRSVKNALMGVLD